MKCDTMVWYCNLCLDVDDIIANTQLSSINSAADNPSNNNIDQNTCQYMAIHVLVC